MARKEKYQHAVNVQDVVQAVLTHGNTLDNEEIKQVTTHLLRKNCTWLTLNAIGDIVGTTRKTTIKNIDRVDKSLLLSHVSNDINKIMHQ